MAARGALREYWMGGRSGRRMGEGVVSGEWVGVMRGAVSG
jgi:hypothetical protein